MSIGNIRKIFGHQGRLYVSTDDAVYVVDGDTLKRLRVEGEAGTDVPMTATEIERRIERCKQERQVNELARAFWGL